MAVEPAAAAGAAAVAGLVTVQSLLRLRPTPPAGIVGLTQAALGLVVVAATAAGITQA